MLSREENEVVTRVGPGTPMGELMRRYWVPAALSRELPEPDCVPVRVKLLGERLVAFRDTSGRLGLVDEFCPHRGASLFLGRNEEDGLRCVYRGWKFDVAGNCLDMLNLPSDATFKTKVRLKSYPTVEQGGIIWVYMGAPEKRPALPLFEWTQLPKTHRFVQKSLGRMQLATGHGRGH
jgi:phenylpropionate dioxygenase-like ring-hydroxylating dioxygenase large terminal subunit